MPAVKTATKKTTTVPVKKSVSKKSTKSTTFEERWAVIEKGFLEIQKSHQEFQKGMQELREVHKKTEAAIEKTRKTVDGLSVAHSETEAAMKQTQKTIDRLSVAQEKTQKTVDRLSVAHSETEAAMKQTQKTIDRLSVAQERTQKTVDGFSAAHERTQKIMDELGIAQKETQRNISGLGKTLGSIVEHIMTPDLPRKFRQFGFAFNRIVTVKWTDGANNPYAQIDGILENGTQAMVVEVKATLRQVDVDNHLSRMEKVRAYADARGDSRQFFGAIAAMSAGEGIRIYTLRQGLFLIEPSGEDVKITEPSGEPRAW
jgi:prefoldin subunit 5